jgi:hypothetical protein
MLVALVFQPLAPVFASTMAGVMGGGVRPSLRAADQAKTTYDVLHHDGAPSISWSEFASVGVNVALDNFTLQSLNSQGSVTEQRVALNNVTTFAFNWSSGQTTATDPRNHAATYFYDTLYRITGGSG